MVQEFDDDSSGLIEFQEFLMLMAKKVSEQAHKHFGGKENIGHKNTC